MFMALSSGFLLSNGLANYGGHADSAFIGTRLIPP